MYFLFIYVFICLCCIDRRVQMFSCIAPNNKMFVEWRQTEDERPWTNLI